MLERLLKLTPYLLALGLVNGALDVAGLFARENVTLMGQLTVAFWIANVMLTIMVAHLAAQLARNERPNLRAAFAMKRFGALFGTNLLANLLILLGALLLVVPGLILAARYAFSTPVVLFEGLSGPAALSRSSDLSEGRRWKLLALMVALFMTPMALRFSSDSLSHGVAVPLSYLANCMELAGTAILVLVYFRLAPQEAAT